MELVQRVIIPAPRQAVWQGLNDPAVLKRSLRGCETFEANAAGGFDIVLQLKVGPVKASFRGEVSLTDVVDGESYTLSGSGKGGVAGYAKGSAHVTLSEPEPGRTEMRYRVDASVGGKLAQVGSRLVDGAARKMANDFFGEFIRVICDDDQVEFILETIEE
ncbi:MAG: carbon monoxide dehydrogenase subunit G [Proteobacteria bacterium]|jgi:uncharacterized protein|nr:carbon monoxide dehydrogenase subunit G [Pseudomonadota bacterium]MDA1301859.1 carbon monoxide dehydrogenase subunit G [Pseudomonadota bacterium]